MPVPEIRMERNKEAVRFLEKVADGRIALGAETPAPVDSVVGGELESATRVFTRDKMRGF
jgi:phage gp36-like protein